MKISTLLEREPFEEIFENTLESFLASWSGQAHVVKWEPKASLNKSSMSQQHWYCNPLINSVFVKGVNADVFESINGEYAYNPMKPWRSSIQRLYLFLSQSKITATKLSKYKVSISPPVEIAENKLIIGGNTKLRIIDLVEEKVYVLLKEGFDKKYIEKEVFVRAVFPYLPIPRIIEFGDNGKWYSEEYISGRPPNRLEKASGNKLLLQAVKCVHQMLNQTKRSVILSEYVAMLEAEINKGIDKILYMNIDVANDIKIIAASLSSFLRKSENQELTLAYCHGDFHQGNIISNDEVYWILDWEYSGEKQIGYDLLILLLESRIENGFSARFLKLVNNQLNDFQIKLTDSWPDLNWRDESIKNRYLMVFLLEDLLFYIGESANNLFYEKADILENRCNEIKKIVTHLL
jgi:thiamine kinase-like enzyme